MAIKKFGQKPAGKGAPAKGPAQSKFKRSAEPEPDADDDEEEEKPAPKGAKKKAGAKKPASRYGGLGFGDDRIDPPTPGVYVLKLVSIEVKTHPEFGTDSHHAHFEVMSAEGKDAEAEGSEVNVLHSFAGKAKKSNGQRVLGMIARLAGIDDEESYDEFDESREFAGGVDDNNGEPLVGRFVAVIVTRGRDCLDKEGNPKMGKDGKPDYYRNYSWETVPDEDQEVAAEWLT